MERPCQSIFGEIQIHVGNSSKPIDPPVHKEETRGKLQRICNQVEECGINGPTTHHQSWRKFHVRGHSALSILWHVGRQCFYGVRDLMYYVGRIEDGIRKGKIADTGQAWGRRKELFPMSMFKQYLERKEGAKEDHIRHGKSLSRIILVCQCMPKSPLSVFSHPKGSYKNTIKGLT